MIRQVNPTLPAPAFRRQGTTRNAPPATVPARSPDRRATAQAATEVAVIPAAAKAARQPTEFVTLAPGQHRKALTAKEREDLFAHEETIERGARAWLDMGLSLTEIRDRMLYREFGTFEQYCWDKFHLDRSTAYRLIDAVRRFHALSPIAEKLRLQFTAESQFRPLAQCEESQLPAVLKLAAKRVEPNAEGNRIPTAKVLAAAVQEVKARATASATKAAPQDVDEGPFDAADDQADDDQADLRDLAQAPAANTKLWNGRPCRHAQDLHALAALLDEYLAVFPDTPDGRRDVADLLTERATMLRALDRAAALKEQP
jgi:hypothetical protein